MAFAVTAVAAAIEITTVASVLTAVAAVGTTMSVVGLVTGSKELTKIGGTLALVGGIGSLANSAFTSLTATAAGSAGAGASEGALFGGEAAAGEGAAAGATDLGAGATGAAGADSIVNTNLDNPLLSASGSSGAAATQPSIMANSGSAFGATPPAYATTATPNASGFYSTPQVTAGVDSFNVGAENAGALAPAGVVGPASPADSAIDAIKRKLGSTWDSLSPQAQAELTKSLLAIPGGIQSQKNTEAALDIQRAKVGQTSYGNQVPTFGILSKAMKG